MKQSASRLLIEGSAIVLSILIAFAIDAAWDTRQQEAEVRAALTDLRAELNESFALLNVTEERIVSDLRYLRGLLAAPEETLRAVHRDSMGVVIESLFRPNTADDNASAILLALDDDRIRQIEDEGLRAAGLQWRQNHAELVERGAVIASVESRSLERLGQEAEVAAVLAGYAEGSDWTVSMAPETLVQMSRDAEIRALVARKALLAEVQKATLIELRSSAEELVAEVERALQTL